MIIMCAQLQHDSVYDEDDYRSVVHTVVLFQNLVSFLHRQHSNITCKKNIRIVNETKEMLIIYLVILVILLYLFIFVDSR